MAPNPNHRTTSALESVPSVQISGETEEPENGNQSLVTATTFEETFDFLMKDAFSKGLLQTSSEEINGKRVNVSQANEWFKTVILYNGTEGKQFRGRLVETAYKLLIPSSTPEMLHICRIVGWALELLQASFLVADDMMDNGRLRRGHLVDNKGNAAINDAILLEHAAYQIVIKYCRHLPCYPNLLELFLDNTFHTLMGQSLDTRSSSALPNSSPFDLYNVELYNSIVRYKTSYYTCYLPVALAMTLAEIPKQSNLSLWKNMERATLEIGHLFQVQDDYLDCFADSDVLGKVGMDIQEGKCSWLFVTAKEMLHNNSNSQDTWQTLQQNYGKLDPNCVTTVKQIYNDLKLPQHFVEYQETLCKNIRELIRSVNHAELEAVLTHFFNMIYKRTY